MLLILIDILIRLLVPPFKYKFSKAPSNISGTFPIWNTAIGQDKKEKDMKGNKVLGVSEQKKKNSKCYQNLVVLNFVLNKIREDS